jgi:hypothetical protein
MSTNKVQQSVSPDIALLHVNVAIVSCDAAIAFKLSAHSQGFQPQQARNLLTCPRGHFAKTCSTALPSAFIFKKDEEWLI